MLAQILTVLCAVLLFALPVHAQDASAPAPYAQAQTNFMYNLLFCDDLILFKPQDGAIPVYWQKTLLAPSPDAQTVRRIAEDGQEESRVRLLAYKWLREHSQMVPQRQLLGVLIEVARDDRQDTLAAYADGRVRYINSSEKLAVIENGSPEIGQQVQALFASSTKLVVRIGPWNKKRLPAPAKGKVRMSFLASDGLYFGEGSFAAIQKDTDAAQVIQDGTALLQLVVKLSAK